MATSQVTLYKNTFLDVHRNSVIDNLNDYLDIIETSGDVLVFNDVQWQRPYLKKTLKLNLTQDYSLVFGNNLAGSVIPRQYKYNYCKIRTPIRKLPPAYEYQYYFIIGYRQVAQQTVELELQMDVLNTCQYDKNYKLDKKSLITREHKDRWKLDSGDNAWRVIDQYQEGLETYLFKTSQETLYDDDNERTWYLVYSSLNAVVSDASDTSEIYVNPVRINLVGDDKMTLVTSSPTRVSFLAQDDRIPDVRYEEEWIVVPKDNFEATGYIEFNNTQYSKNDFDANHNVIVIRRKNNSDVTFYRIYYMKIENGSVSNSQVIGSNVDGVVFYGINVAYIYHGISFAQSKYYGELLIGSGTNSITQDFDAWKDLDITDPKLIKAINFPYSPTSFVVGKNSFNQLPTLYQYNSTLKALELVKGQENDFDRQIHFNLEELDSPWITFENQNDISDLYKQQRSIYWESKLFHSDFFQPKFVYDSYSFTFRLEDVDVDELVENFVVSDFIARYVVSGNVLSKFMFQFPQYICKRSMQDYEDVMIIDRNNEKALYNNAYINYIRTGGYSYDSKKANSQNAMNGISTALSLVGSIVSFASTPVSGGIGIASGIGLAIGTIGSVIKNIHSAQEQDRAISQKLAQLTNQATNVSGNEDIDILKAFSGNKAKLCYYEPSTIMKNALWDLFHYCGYATHEQKVPDVSSRIYFNYVQGEVLLKEYYFDEDIANAIIEKWKEGITFFHSVWDEDEDEYYWDFNQEYENFETSLIV